MFGIIIGAVAGTILSVVSGVWLIQKQQQWKEDEIKQEEEENIKTVVTDIPVKKKLLDAIFNCEQNINACKNQINAICKDQLDLLQDVGTISHVEVKDKPLFFEFYNPIDDARHYYYTRDLSNDIDSEVLANSQKIATKYAKHIDLLMTQKELFERLIESHKENLDRVNGVQNQGKQVLKLNKHKNKLSKLGEDSKIEEQAIYNDLIIEGINEELDHQEECLRQYIQLNQKYDNPFDEQIEEKFKVEIQEIINQLENEDPNNTI